MIKILTKKERDFNVCSDCIHFLFQGYVDERYPIKSGKCQLKNIFVNDVFECTCDKIEEIDDEISEDDDVFSTYDWF